MRIKEKISALLSPKIKEYIIFIIGGGIGALVNWLISFVMTSLMGIHYIVSYSAAQIINISVNFVWHQHVTFGVKDESASRFIRFIIMSVVTALFSIALVYLTKEYVLDRLHTIYVRGYDLNYLATIIFITFVVSIINYVVSRIWVFEVHRSTSHGD